MSNTTGCESAYEIAFHPFYRTSQIYTCFVSIGAVFPLICLIFYKIPRTTFNKNVKCLYMLYFSLILISVINNTVVFGHHVVIPFVSSEPCDVMVDQSKLRILQYFGLFGISCPMLMILGITVERLLALIFARCYENSRLLIGVLIGFVVVTTDIVIVFTLFRDEKFDKPTMSYFLVPATSGKSMLVFCYSLLAVNWLNFIFNRVLVKMSSILREKWRSDLSTRFQMEENIITTKFSTYIAFFHVFFFMLYLVFSLVIRTILGPYFLTNSIDYSVILGVYITIPTYNLLIGFVACSILKRLQSLKVAKVSAEVALQYSGSEGAHNHEEAILHVWNTTNIKPH